MRGWMRNVRVKRFVVANGIDQDPAGFGWRPLRFILSHTMPAASPKTVPRRIATDRLLGAIIFLAAATCIAAPRR